MPPSPSWKRLKECNMKLPFSHFLLSPSNTGIAAGKRPWSISFVTSFQKPVGRTSAFVIKLPPFSVLHSSCLKDSFLPSGMRISILEKEDLPFLLSQGSDRSTKLHDLFQDLRCDRQLTSMPWANFMRLRKVGKSRYCLGKKSKSKIGLMGWIRIWKWCEMFQWDEQSSANWLSTEMGQSVKNKGEGWNVSSPTYAKWKSDWTQLPSQHKM